MADPRQTLAQSLASSFKKFIDDPESIQTPQEVPFQQIKLPPKRQARRYFDLERQAQLVQSIQEHGILEPLLVRPVDNENYELIAGERRYRAAETLGLQNVPVVVREFDDRQALQVALIENLQREDLNPVEETEGILELLALEINGTPDDVASILHRANHAKNRGQELEENVFLQFQTIESVLANIGRFSAESFRTSRLPLLNLPDNVLMALRQGKIEFTKARAIARVKDEEQRKVLLEAAIAENLSLSQIKERIAELKALETEVEQPNIKQKIDAAYQRFKKSKAWDDPKKQKKLERILKELEDLAKDIE